MELEADNRVLVGINAKKFALVLALRSKAGDRNGLGLAERTSREGAAHDRAEVKLESGEILPLTINLVLDGEINSATSQRLSSSTSDVH